MTERIIIGRWRYPFGARQLGALAKLAASWCKANGYGEPHVATDGPDHEQGWLTVVASQPSAPLLCTLGRPLLQCLLPYRHSGDCSWSTE